jgi:hypothetical protein
MSLSIHDNHVLGYCVNPTIGFDGSVVCQSMTLEPAARSDNQPPTS